MEQNNPIHPILNEIEAFCRAQHVALSTFGYRAVGDPALVATLRRGREPRRATVRQIRHYMLTGERLGVPEPSEGSDDARISTS